MVSVTQVMSALVSSRGTDGIQWTAAQWSRVWAVLTPREQDVVYHHLVVGRTHTEVADLLGIGRGAVDGAWRRALERIRDAVPTP